MTSSPKDVKMFSSDEKRNEADDSISNLLYNSVSCVMDENQQTTEQQITEQYSDVLRKHGVDILPFTKEPSQANNMMRKYASYLASLPPAALLALANPRIGRPRKNVLASNNVSIEPVSQSRPSDPNSSYHSDVPRRKVGRPVGWRKNRDFQIQPSPAVEIQRKKAGRPKGWRKPRDTPMPMPLPQPMPLKEGLGYTIVGEVTKKKRGRPRLADTVYFEDPSVVPPPEAVSYIDDGGHFLLPS